jgi:hypothetical protein
MLFSQISDFVQRKVLIKWQQSLGFIHYIQLQQGNQNYYSLPCLLYIYSIPYLLSIYSIPVWSICTELLLINIATKELYIPAATFNILLKFDRILKYQGPVFIVKFWYLG